MGLKFTSIGLILIIILIYFNSFFLAGITALILLISALIDLMPVKKTNFLKKEINKEIKTISDNAGKQFPHEGIKSNANDLIQGTTDNIYGPDIGENKPMIGEPISFLGQASENFLNGLKSLFKKK